MTNTRRLQLLAGVAVALLLAFRLSAPQGHPAWDAAILGWFSQHRSDPLDRLIIAITWLGSLWILGPAAALIAWRLNKLDRLNHAWLLLGTLGGVAMIGRMAKWWIERPRPDLHTWLPVLPMDTSYPSLHALQATAFFLALAMIVRRTWFWPVAVTTAALVALSRLYLQVHYPSDIAAGVGGATLWTLAVYWTRNTIDAK
jgi:membrane-associated phospholipid phosphatase